MRRAAGTLLLTMAAGFAQAQGAPEALDWLRRITQATDKLSYTGTFVYQQGGRTETSRITRRADANGGVERLETLDGPPREVVRTRDEVRCYLPDTQTIKVSRRRADRGPGFPALLPAQVSGLGEHYTITLGGTARVAGYDCQAVVLAPRDELRYGYRLWADVQSGMLLKAQAFNGAGDTVEEFTFTQLEIGMPRERLRPRYSVQAWRIEQAAVAPGNVALAGWRVETDLPGFRKVIEVKRMLGDTRPVDQVVYSDGLAAVSVFIEPMRGRGEPPRMGLATMGAVNVYTREVADHLVTVVGEAPAASVQRIGNRVEFRPPQ